MHPYARTGQGGSGLGSQHGGGGLGSQDDLVKKLKGLSAAQLQKLMEDPELQRALAMQQGYR